MMQTRPDISVCIVNWNTREYLDGCLGSLQEIPDAATREVIVVDNASEDGSAAMVRDRHPDVLLIANEHNAGFAAGNNQALEVARGEFKLVLNPDIIVRAWALDRMLELLARRPEAGAVAPRLILPDGRIQASCRCFPTPGIVAGEVLGLGRLWPRSRRFGSYRMTWWGYDDERCVDQPQASALLLRSAGLDEVGLFDEGFPIFFNDVDLSKRMADAGWQTWFTPRASMTHFGGASTSQRPRRMIIESHRSFLRFYEKHYLGRIPAWQYVATRALLRASGWLRAAEATMRARR